MHWNSNLGEGTGQSYGRGDSQVPCGRLPKRGSFHTPGRARTGRGPTGSTERSLAKLRSRAVCRAPPIASRGSTGAVALRCERAREPPSAARALRRQSSSPACKAERRRRKGQALPEARPRAGLKLLSRSPPQLTNPSPRDRLKSQTLASLNPHLKHGALLLPPMCRLWEQRANLRRPMLTAAAGC
eukprot:91145-Chlamydomonas_euryale.AAC.2